MQSSLVKLIVVGDSNVGKTSLISRYVDDTFAESIGNTVGVDFFACKMDLFGQTHTVQLWDTAGQERFKSVVKCYFKSASGVLIVFDLTQRVSFDHVATWLEDMNDNVPENVVKVLVGSKADLEEKRAISYEDARGFAESRNMQYFETSAKSAFGVDVLFESVVKTILEGLNSPGQEQKVEPNNPPMIKLASVGSPRPTLQNKNKCCDF